MRVTAWGLPAQKAEARKAEALAQSRVEGAYLWESLGSAEGGQDALPEQQYDQSEAFEYCLHLYNSVPQVRASKAGSYTV